MGPPPSSPLPHATAENTRPCTALFRILITPIDAFKTTLQVKGAEGLTVLAERISANGVFTLYSGALGSSLATLMGHYPWFIVFNFLQVSLRCFAIIAPRMLLLPHAAVCAS